MRLTRRALLLSLAIAVASQIAWAGGHHSGSSSVHVRGYYRKDGTYVSSYDRAAPGTASASYPSTPSIVSPSATPNLSPQTSVYAPAPSSASLPTTPVSVTSNAPKYIAAAPDPATTYHVHGYHRSDGTYVQEYVRSAPGSADTVVATATSRTPVTDTASSRASSTQTSFSSGVQRDAHGRIKRSESAKREFMRTTGYPSGRPGYVVDHIIPLKRGGCDCPSNMEWQTIADAKAKDKVE